MSKKQLNKEVLVIAPHQTKNAIQKALQYPLKRFLGYIPQPVSYEQEWSRLLDYYGFQPRIFSWSGSSTEKRLEQAADQLYTAVQQKSPSAILALSLGSEVASRFLNKYEESIPTLCIAPVVQARENNLIHIYSSSDRFASTMNWLLWPSADRFDETDRLINIPSLAHHEFLPSTHIVEETVYLQLSKML